MSAKKTDNQQPVMGFTVQVDGKLYGPFPEKQREKFKHLQHKKGVTFKPVPLVTSSLSLSLSLVPRKDGKKSILRCLKGWILRLRRELGIGAFRRFCYGYC